MPLPTTDDLQQPSPYIPQQLPGYPPEKQYKLVSIQLSH